MVLARRRSSLTLSKLTESQGAARGGIGQHYKTLHVDELIIFGKVC